MRTKNLPIAVAVILTVVTMGGCGGMHCADPEPPVVAPEVVTGRETAPMAAAAAPGAAQPEKSWIDSVDLEKVLTSPWLIAGAFLLIQWFEIWYFNRTGRKSATIDAAEAAMAPKLGIVQLGLYRLWRWVYFWKHKDKRDPDKEGEEKKN